jgi:hypothetical protein
MSGSGTYAAHLSTAFDVFLKKYGLDGPLPELDTTQFRRPREPSGQRTLF